MLVYGLRLFVALITFAVGVTASRLGGSGCSSRGQRGGVSYSHQYTVTTRTDIPQAESPKRECRLAISPPVIGGGILNGRARSLPRPDYPAEAKAARARGSVPVRVVVDVNGRVTWAQAVGGPKLLRGAAEEAAHAAVFAPTLISGNPVKIDGIINYNFLPR
jgi:TonB family protein